MDKAMKGEIEVHNERQKMDVPMEELRLGSGYITSRQIYSWLGFSSDEFKLSEAIDILKDIANNRYSQKELRKDLIAYVDAKKKCPYK
jgi:hypothetical protein